MSHQLIYTALPQCKRPNSLSPVDVVGVKIRLTLAPFPSGCIPRIVVSFLRAQGFPPTLKLAAVA